MGHTDLQKIKLGFIAASEYSLTKAGMIMGMIGTFFGIVGIIFIGIAIAVGLSLFSAQAIQANKDAMINDLNSIAASAYQYSVNHDNSYHGFELPPTYRTIDYAKYYLQRASDGRLALIAVSTHRKENSIAVMLDSGGLLTEWQYAGDFQ